MSPIHHPPSAGEAGAAPEGQRREGVEVVLVDGVEGHPFHGHELVHQVGMLDQEPTSVDLDSR